MVDGELLKVLARTMNFHIVFVNNTNRDYFGDVMPDGNYSGALNALENGEVDLGANVRTIQIKKLQKSSYLYPILQKGFCALVPKKPYSFKVSYLEAMEYWCSFALLVFMSSLFLVWINLTYIHKGLIYSEEHLDTIRIALLIFGALLVTSQPRVKFRHEKYLIVAVFMCSMILSSTYQAKMVQHLTTSIKSLDIKNVHELLESNLKIIIPFSLKSAIKLESLSSDELIKGRTLIAIKNHSQGIERLLTKKDCAYIISDMFGELVQSKYYDQNNVSLVHVIRTVKTIPASLMTLKNSPYKNSLNRILLNLCENGVIKKIMNDVMYEINLMRIKKEMFQKEVKNYYTMEQLEFIFKAFFATMCGWCFVFLFEVLIYQHQTRRDLIIYGSIRI